MHVDGYTLSSMYGTQFPHMLLTSCTVEAAARNTLISSRHRVAAIRLIKERVEHHNPYPGDNTMLAVIGLVAKRGSRVPLPNKNKKVLHVQGLRATIAARGRVPPGLCSLTVYWLLSW